MNEVQELLLHVLVQLVVIISAARAGAWLLGRLGQPQVVGEIVAGLILGPTVLGRLSPQSVEYLFPADVSVVFNVLSELGLVLLMFLIGLEFDFSHLRTVRRSAVSVASAGIILPFALGALLAMWMQPRLASDVNAIGFILIVAVAMSITAIPILGRIMIELNIHRTPIGTLTITAAAIDDAVGWILLALAGGIVQGGFEPWAMARMVLLTLAFVLGVVWLFRPFLVRFAGRLASQSKGSLTVNGLSAVLVMVLLAAAATNAIGIFAIFGPFVLGAALSDQHHFRQAVSSKLHEIVYALFLPIFFTYTGLRTNIGLLDSWEHWWICGLVVAVAMFGKMFGCGAASLATGMSWRESGCVAVLMNTRALMGLIAINVGRDAGVIPDSVFCMLVIMALVTTFVTTPALRWLLPVEYTSPKTPRLNSLS